jgi:hypothetical protein
VRKNLIHADRDVRRAIQFDRYPVEPGSALPESIIGAPREKQCGFIGKCELGMRLSESQELENVMVLVHITILNCLKNGSVNQVCRHFFPRFCNDASEGIWIGVHFKPAFG